MLTAPARLACFGTGSSKVCRKVPARPNTSAPGTRGFRRQQQGARAVATAAVARAPTCVQEMLPGAFIVPRAAKVAPVLRAVYMAGAEHQGFRPRMEDTYFTVLLHPDDGVQQMHGPVATQTAGVAAAAVFDGHAGSGTAKQAALHTPHLLHAALTGQYSTASQGPQVLSPAALQPSAALSASLQCFDSWWSRKHGDDRSGSTAVMGMVAGDDLYVANTGDSVALLARGGRSQRLSVDHRADNAAELMRVLSAGGEVDYDRFGTLRVYRPSDIGRTNGAMFTRSLGDFHFKEPEPLLTSAPHVTHQQLCPDDQLVLLSSDGVTDVLPDDDIMELALKAVDKAKNRTDDGEQLAEAASIDVIRAALRHGSADNITAVAMLLDWS